MKKINLKEKFSLFEDHWSPKIIGENEWSTDKGCKGQR